MSEKMYPIKLYLRHLPNAVILGAGLIVNLANWAWLLWNIRATDELIFLHYNILFGADLLGSWFQVYYLPLIGLLIMFINAGLGWLLFSRHPFFSYMLNAAATIVQIFLFIAGALLVFLNT